ncbi:hypothetical protein [Streptomyces orinoci]|uniref:Integral membrane protein n=1 Tax=Streptomyces orinoci TaxID=67339 RepID=A0ABV3JZK9_STRON|nr:hypothetical protein [Streptomyces orinoci]
MPGPGGRVCAGGTGARTEDTDDIKEIEESVRPYREEAAMPAHILPGHHTAHPGPGPVPRDRRLPARITRTGPVPDTSRPAWLVPVIAGVVLGLYTVFLSHDNGFSEGSGWLLGLAAAVISAGVGYLLVRERNAMSAEVRAATFGALLGGSIGFLHSVAGGSWLRSSGIGLGFGIGMALVSYYVFYEHEH